ncbi:hypothetical protein SAMN02745131_00443 [Flavisolibacter ginsengisoli DSM 18119]|jgi:hypothetical protein|uniref:Uncharacterized protein n=1 Tax=Flavisolibacter ginsengisoli DSM 18119 TaxID=1121884 RepID=A0A1M4TX53_9BACT|nr:hypothetical protein SAMN02745131_00443 [Flavisolibacter ginsengisoli DSM 18119]
MLSKLIYYRRTTNFMHSSYTSYSVGMPLLCLAYTTYIALKSMSSKIISLKEPAGWGQPLVKFRISLLVDFRNGK